MNTRSPQASKAPKRGVGRPAAPDIVDRILRAAEALFSTRGFHGTGIREIADKVGITAGNVYNHFETKEGLFAALMADLEAKYLSETQPIPRALLAMEAFPEGLEALGQAAQEQVRRFPGYIRLIYVDVIEFEGKHLQRLYGGMRTRFEAIFRERFAALRREGKLGDVDPLAAIMMATISYMHYFTVEQVFGVKGHFGMSDASVVREMAAVVKRGVLARGPAGA